MNFGSTVAVLILVIIILISWSITIFGSMLIDAGGSSQHSKAVSSFVTGSIVSSIITFIAYKGIKYFISE